MTNKQKLKFNLKWEREDRQRKKRLEKERKKRERKQAKRIIINNNSK